MFDKYKPTGLGKTSKSQIKADKAAVMRMIENDSLSSGGKIRIKRTGKTAVVWAACVAAVSVMSVSAAAVGGLIDFNALFGRFYKTANENVASTIMKSADNIVCEMTDSDYIINVKGIAGDEMTVMLSAELCRTDGTAVREHFINRTDEKSPIPLNFREYLSDPGINTGSSICFRVNERGNIDITASVFSQNEPINGNRVTIKGDTLFNAGDDYYEALKNYPTDHESAAKGFILLNIGWELSFDYNYSEDEAVTKTLASDEPFTYHLSIAKNTSDGEYMPEKQYDVKASSFKLTAGAIKCSVELDYPATEYDLLSYEDGYAVDYSGNEFILIMSDGSQVIMEAESYTWSHGSDTCHHSCTFHYCDSSYSPMIADIENAAAVSINGALYRLG